MKAVGPDAPDFDKQIGGRQHGDAVGTEGEGQPGNVPVHAPDRDQRDDKHQARAQAPPSRRVELTQRRDRDGVKRIIIR